MRAFLFSVLISLVLPLHAQLRNGTLVNGELRNATPAAVVGGGSNPPASPLVNQNFEGAGYDNTETWSETGFGTKDEDYTTTVLLGSQSLHVTVPDSSSGRTDTGFSSGSERWGFCLVHFINAPSLDSYFIFFDDSGFNRPFRIGAGAGSTLKVFCGSASQTTVATFATGTTYYLWWHYLKGTGSDAIAELWFSTTSTKPADGSNNHAKTTAGTSTTDVNNLALGAEAHGGSDASIIFDHIYVDDAVILSNP